MRRLSIVFGALAVIATACSSSSTEVVGGVSAGAVEAETEVRAGAASDPEVRGTDEPDEHSGAAATAEPTAEPGPVAEPTCGFDDEIEPSYVSVAQIRPDGRESNPSALQSFFHQDFPEPLVDPSQILSGGPPPDGIPPIDDPIFQTAATVDWLRCNEPVLSLVIEGEARAYPIQIMTWHEIVNDTLGDTPVTVSFCPLCNSALVYRRDVGDRILSFGTSGALFNSSLVMYDRQTQSLWTHFNGAAVVGTLTGTQLELLPVQTTSWANFLANHPDGAVLTRDTGFSRPYGNNPYVGYDNAGEDPFLFRGEIDERLAAKERVVSVRLNGDSSVVVLERLVADRVVSLEVGGQPLTVWHLPGTSSALDAQAIAEGRDVGAVGVFIPEVDGRLLTFTREADGFVDAETGSIWTIAGIASQGELAGARLEAVPHLDTFWFAIAAFEPDTQIVT